MYLSDIYTISCNLAGLCGISVPCGFSKAGLPIGLQLGEPFGEPDLLRAAHAYEQATDWHASTKSGLMEYEAVIGLETHVQLKTRTKMWCGCANEYGADANTNVCPVCLGLPGVLPVPNAEALRLTALTGFLLNCDVPGYAKWDGKIIFTRTTPRIISLPSWIFHPPSPALWNSSWVGSWNPCGSIAPLGGGCGQSFHFADYSGVDFNRAGVPLLEIVTEPDITSGDMAYEYLNALKSILEYGGVSDCDMEKGQVRCDVNISVRPKGQQELGEKMRSKT